MNRSWLACHYPERPSDGSRHVHHGCKACNVVAAAEIMRQPTGVNQYGEPLIDIARRVLAASPDDLALIRAVAHAERAQGVTV
jgi:hypothetical protein